MFRVLAVPLSIILLVLLIISRTRSFHINPASKLYSLYTSASIAYLIANGLEISSRTVEANLFWARTVYIFLSFIPMTWFLFSLGIRNKIHLTKFLIIIPLFIIPLLTIVFIYSEAWSVYVWKSIEFIELDGYIISIKNHGPWFYVFMIYIYSITLAGMILIVRSLTFHRQYFRRRTIFILIGVSIPLLMNLPYVFNFYTGLTKDYAAIAFAISNIFFFFALYRLDAFAIIPIARDCLIENMAEGILVFDIDFRIIDENSSVLEMFGITESLIGKQIFSDEREQAFLPEPLVNAVFSGQSTHFIISGKIRRHVLVETVDLPGRSGLLGRLVVIRDETELRNALERVEELARMDPLTGLANRRGFSEAAETCISIASRYGELATLAIFDLDNFKEVNDRCGHATGDMVLKKAAEILTMGLRSADIAGRLGGDEFIVIFPRTDAEGAHSVCERIRRNFASHIFFFEDECCQSVKNPAPEAFSVTLSIGISCMATSIHTLDQLSRMADKALYSAKEAGRNRIVIAPLVS